MSTAETDCLLAAKYDLHLQIHGYYEDNAAYLMSIYVSDNHRFHKSLIK